MKYITTGFTLLELVIVIALITLLSAVLFPSFRGLTQSQALNQTTEVLVTYLYTTGNNTRADGLRRFVECDTTGCETVVYKRDGQIATEETLIYDDGVTGTEQTMWFLPPHGILRLNEQEVDNEEDLMPFVISLNKDSVVMDITLYPASGLITPYANTINPQENAPEGI